MADLEQEMLERPLLEVETDLNDPASVKHFGVLWRKLKPDKYIIRISRWRKRGTAKQRRRYFAILRVIAKFTGDDIEDLHEAVKLLFLARTVKIKLTGRDEVLAGSTRELTTDEYNLLTDSVIALAFDTLGLVISDSDTYYDQQ
jgi:hypothetical protein